MMTIRSVGSRSALHKLQSTTSLLSDGGPLQALGVGRSIHLGPGNQAQRLSRHNANASATTLRLPTTSKFTSQVRTVHSTKILWNQGNAASSASVNETVADNGSNGTQPTLAPAEISIEEYHERADAFMEELVGKLEELQEKRDDVDVEYTVCYECLVMSPHSTSLH